MGEMKKMESFGDQDIFSWFKGNVSLAFYEENISHFENSYGKYVDSTNMADAYLSAVKRLLQKGVSEEDVRKFDTSTAHDYVAFADRLSVDEFLKLLKECNYSIKSLELRLADNLGEKLILKGMKAEGILYRHLNDSYRKIADRLSEKNGRLLLAGLLSRNFCIANLSGLNDCIMEKTTDISVGNMAVPKGEDILLWLLMKKLLDNFGSQPLVTSMLKETSKMNPQKLYWVAFRSENRRFLRPLYQVIDDNFEFDSALRGGTITGRYVGGNVLCFEVTAGGEPSPFNYLPAPLAVDNSVEFPLEKMYGDTRVCKALWLYPFVVADGADWEYAWENGKNTLAVLDAWKPGYSFDEAMMSFLRHRLSGSFPEGNFHEAVFRNGNVVDLRRFFAGEQKEVIAALNENGFPDCSFR